MSTAQDYARTLFYWCFVLEVVYIGIRASISVADIKETLQNFIMAIITAFFFLAVINNYEAWSHALIHGLQSAADKMSGLEKASDNPMKAGLELASSIYAKVSKWSPIDSLGFIMASVFVVVCFALITAQVILIKCEALIAMLAACLLLGLGATKFFREYAVNTIRYVFSVAFKLFTMQLVIGIGYTFIDEVKVGGTDWPTLFVTMAFSVVLLAIVRTLPETVGGIISGSHAGNGGGLMKMVVTGAALTAGAAIGGAKGVQAVNRAKNVAQGEGAKGFAAVAKGMGSAMMAARHQSKMNKTSMGGELKNRINTMKETK